MSSFEDLQAVDFDYDEGTFTMIRNSGLTRTYYIEEESILVQDIIEAGDRGELEIYEISSPDVVIEFNGADVTFSNYGDSFNDWKW